MILIAAALVFGTGPAGKEHLPINFTVGNTTGIVADKNLDFGQITPGGSITKTIILKNNKPYPATLTITPSPGIAPYFTPHPNYVLNANTNTSINFTITVPLNATYASHHGYLTITRYKYEPN